jgi:molybdopterin-guanine dinucleotide biosynthesis protein A
MNRVYKDITGIILAGGKSSRMGSAKEFLSVNGRRMIDNVLDVLTPLFCEILVVTNDKKRFTNLRRAEVIEDLVRGRGPLGGIYTGLRVISSEKAFFVACDMPFLHIGLINQQISHFNELDCNCCVPRIGGTIEPLHAVYKKGLKDEIGRFLEGSSLCSVKNFLEKIDVCYWDLEDNICVKKIFRNLNTHEDLKEAINDEGEI